MGEVREAQDGGDIYIWLICVVVQQKPIEQSKEIFLEVKKEKKRKEKN